MIFKLLDMIEVWDARYDNLFGFDAFFNKQVSVPARSNAKNIILIRKPGD